MIFRDNLKKNKRKDKES